MMKLDKVARELRYKRGLLELLNKAYGSRTLEILEALSKAPKEYAVRVNMLKASPEEAVRELEVLGVFCRRSQTLDEAVLIDVTGPYEVEKKGKQVVAEKSAAESVMMGSKLYGPGILRTDKYRVGDPVYVTDVYNHVVANGIAKAPPKTDRNRAKGIAVDTRESVYRLPPIRESELFKRGMIREQSLPAMITSRVLDPQKGEIVVDMCAAPGGKSLHLAQLMGGEGIIYAFDHSEKRINAFRSEIARLETHNIKIFCSDSRYLDWDFPGLKADRVLVDPPCSALGVRPKLYEDASVEEVNGCARYQKQFLKTASRIVRNGGTVVYSTCTLTVEENEDVMRYAVEDLQLEPEAQSIKVGEEGFGGAIFCKAQRFSPDILETPGYFIAKFRKK